MDDAPFVAVDFDVAGVAEEQRLTFHTQVGDVAVASADLPIRVVRDAQTGEPSPYVRVRRNLDALIDRKSFYRLVELGAHHDGWVRALVSGQFFR